MEFIKKNWQLVTSSNLELKDFALVMGFVFVLIGLVRNGIKIELTLDNLLLWGLVILLVGIVKPDLLILFQKGWMTFGLVMSSLVSRVILFIIYIAVFLPIGFLLKFVMQKKLLEEVDKSSKSYWSVRKEPLRSKGYYQKQF